MNILWFWGETSHVHVLDKFYEIQLSKWSVITFPTSTGSDTYRTTHTILHSTQQKRKQEKSSLSLMLIILLYIFIICTEKRKRDQTQLWNSTGVSKQRGIEKERVLLDRETTKEVLAILPSPCLNPKILDVQMTWVKSKTEKTKSIRMLHHIHKHRPPQPQTLHLSANPKRYHKTLNS